MRRRLTVIALAVAFGFGLVGSASATPIECSPAQTAVHTADAGWYCENPAGHPNASEKPKHR
jgi:hypothetical protein